MSTQRIARDSRAPGAGRIVAPPPAEPNVYAEGTPEAQAFAYLAGKGQRPTPAAVSARVLDVAGRRARDEANRPRNNAWRTEALAEGRRVARIIARARARYGVGPTWRELWRFLGWTRPEAHVKYAALRAAGVITYSRDRRSLDTGPTYREAKGGANK